MNKRGQYDYWTLVVRTRLRMEARNCGPFPDPKETGLPMKRRPVNLTKFTSDVKNGTAHPRQPSAAPDRGSY